MAIGTIDRTPPPFFRQGHSALTKLILCSALALFLMVADTRFTLAQQLRAVVATLLYYPQQALLVPVQMFSGGSEYFIGQQKALSNEEAARLQLARQAERALQVDQLLSENAHLRGLLDLRPRLGVHSQAAQILYEASDPYSRKVVIDRGAISGIVIASPVINEAGVLGQVTRVYPLSSEVTLLNDKDAAIPVLNARTQVRSAAFGNAGIAGRGDGDAFHGRQCRCAGRRSADHFRGRRHLSAWPAGRQGRQRGPQGRFGLRAHRADAERAARWRAARAGAGADRPADAATADRDRRGFIGLGAEAGRAQMSMPRRIARARAMIMPREGSREHAP